MASAVQHLKQCDPGNETSSYSQYLIEESLLPSLLCSAVDAVLFGRACRGVKGQALFS